MTLPLVRDIRGRPIRIPRVTNALSLDAEPSMTLPPATPPLPNLNLISSFPRIKRRSAFVKHVKAKHNIDLNTMSVDEAAAAEGLFRASPDAERIATPPPDYTTASKEPMYREEDLPTFSSDVMPKEEVHTPPSIVTPPPAVIEVVPSPEGYKWSSAGFIGSCFPLWVTFSCLVYNCST